MSRITGIALVGTLLGQLFFGVLGDKMGRKKVYLITLLLMITATIGQASSASTVRGFGMVTWLVLWRFVLGFGIGGEYPLSATIAAELSPSHVRGASIAAVFSMQGVGILTASIVGLVTVSAFKPLIVNNSAHSGHSCWNAGQSWGGRAPRERAGQPAAILPTARPPPAAAHPKPRPPPPTTLSCRHPVL